jgi:hypothetical protein
MVVKLMLVLMDANPLFVDGEIRQTGIDPAA